MTRYLLPLPFVFAGLGMAFYYQTTIITSSGTLPATCVTGGVFVKTGSAPGFYFCDASPAWVGPITSGNGDVVGPGSSTDNAVARFDGTTGKLLQNTANLIVADDGTITFADGIKQTFNPDGTNAGFNVGSQAGDPSSLANGDCWYNSSSGQYKCRINGVTVSLGPGGSGTVSCIVAGSDDSDSDDTVHNDPELAFSVSASTTYLFELTLLFNTGTSNTPDAKYLFTLPASATLTQSGTALITVTNVTTALYQIGEYAATTPTAAIAIGVLTTATQQVTSAQVVGVVNVAGTAGTVQVQWAQNTTTGGTPTVRRAGSKLCYQAQ
ncbi:MAG TPA: hypothetical protein VM531_11050 [Sphingomicrobium sp.]|jgi:hypothetical protein|nr:hypothetical protein [Sphingomicrobium sp.]